jgi:hypothetical protein
MNDLDAILRSDADRWQAGLRPVADLDEQLRAVLERPPRTRRLLLPLLAAAIVVAIAVTLVMAGLTGKDRNRPGLRGDFAQVTGVMWRDPNSPATVVYTDTTMRLFDGCTNQLTNLLIEHGKLVQGKRIGRFGVCTGPPILPGSGRVSYRAQQERLAHFYAVIAGPASWSRTGDVLTLTAPGKGTLHLTTNNARAPMLVGTVWTLTYYSATDQNEHPATRPVKLIVYTDGSFTAGLNCGDLTGTTRVSARTIHFTKVNSSSCAGGLDAASKVVFDVVVARKATYAIRGTELIIDRTNGQQLIYQS